MLAKYLNAEIGNTVTVFCKNATIIGELSMYYELPHIPIYTVKIPGAQITFNLSQIVNFNQSQNIVKLNF